MYASDINRIRFRDYTENVDLVSRDEERNREKAIERIETVTVRLRRKMVKQRTGTTVNSVLHAPIFKEDIIKKLWQQHYIKINSDALLVSDAGINVPGNGKKRVMSSSVTLVKGPSSVDVVVGKGVTAKLQIDLETW